MTTWWIPKQGQGPSDFLGRTSKTVNGWPPTWLLFVGWRQLSRWRCSWCWWPWWSKQATWNTDLWPTWWRRGAEEGWWPWCQRCNSELETSWCTDGLLYRGRPDPATEIFPFVGQNYSIRWKKYFLLLEKNIIFCWTKYFYYLAKQILFSWTKYVLQLGETLSFSWTIWFLSSDKLIYFVG